MRISGNVVPAIVISTMVVSPITATANSMYADECVEISGVLAEVTARLAEVTEDDRVKAFAEESTLTHAVMSNPDKYGPKHHVRAQELCRSWEGKKTAEQTRIEGEKWIKAEEEKKRQRELGKVPTTKE